MSTRIETVHNPLVECITVGQLDENLDYEHSPSEADDRVLVLSYDEVVVISGDLEKFARDVDRAVHPGTTSSASVSTAFNEAVDQIIDLVGGDERLTDAINLVVNVGLHFLEHPGSTVDDAIRASYDQSEEDENDIVDTVLGWLVD